MDNIGENFVILCGFIVDNKFSNVGNNNNAMLKAKIAIPVNDFPNKYQYVKITAWGFNAESLNSLGKKKLVRVLGHIEESSFDGNCNYCNGRIKKFWTEVVVDTFTIVK